MGTRTQIQVAGQPVMLYAHWDGYPEGILPYLVPIVDYFMTKRGWDDSYMMAQIAFHFGRLRAKPDEMTSYGLDTEVHGDLDYFYTIEETGAIRINSRRPDGSLVQIIERGAKDFPGYEQIDSPKDLPPGYDWPHPFKTAAPDGPGNAPALST